MLGLAFAVNLWFLIAVPLVGYAFAWYAHFFVEHNRPATFDHPFYSLAADYRMLFLMMAGQMDAEVEALRERRHGDPSVGVSVRFSFQIGRFIAELLQDPFA